MYGVFDFVSGFSLFSHIRYDYSTNAIVNSESTDLRTRVRTSSYLNLGNKNSFSANINLGKRIKPLGIRYNLRLGSGFSKAIYSFDSMPSFFSIISLPEIYYPLIGFLCIIIITIFLKKRLNEK